MTRSSRVVSAALVLAVVSGGCTGRTKAEVLIANGILLGIGAGLVAAAKTPKERSCEDVSCGFDGVGDGLVSAMLVGIGGVSIVGGLIGMGRSPVDVPPRTPVTSAPPPPFGPRPTSVKARPLAKLP